MGEATQSFSVMHHDWHSRSYVENWIERAGVRHTKHDTVTRRRGDRVSMHFCCTCSQPLLADFVAKVRD